MSVSLLSKLSRFASDNRVKFAIVFLLVNLHQLRNVSTIGYLAVYIPVFAYLLVRFAVAVRRDVRPWDRRPLLVLVGVVVTGTVMSLVFISWEGVTVGLGRLLFAVPILLALYLYTESLSELRHHLVTFAVFFCVAALTIPLQLLTGPISWFTKASERGDIERYSSLVGALTAIGVVISGYLVLAQAARIRLRIVLVILISAASLFSLSKAAFVNMALGLVILIVLNARALRKNKRVLRWVALTAGAVVAVVAVCYAFIEPFSARINTVLLSFGLQNDDVVRDDRNVLQSAVDRLTLLPQANFEALVHLDNPFAFLFGGGFGLASTALVPRKDSLGPMAHNQFVELITVFGFVGGILTIAVLVWMFVRLVRLARRDRSRTLLVVVAAYATWVINAVFANGALYQPASASLFYVALFAAIWGHLLVGQPDAPVAAAPKPGPLGAWLDRHAGRSVQHG